MLSTKSQIVRNGERLSPTDVVANLDGSLRQLRTGHVDVFLLHGVAPAHYDYSRDVIKPALRSEQAKGKFRYLGLSETSPNDPDQTMLQRALDDPDWRVVMFAYHMLNQGARRDVFPRTRAQGVGTLLMFVVRNIFSRPGLLAETLRALATEGKLPPDLAEPEAALSFLLHDGGAADLIDAAYRFARHEPGSDVVLFGTSNIAHLESNIASILRPPLPADDVARLYRTFSALRGVGLDLPDRVKHNKT